MTTPSTARKAGPFNGTGSQTAWPFTFKVFSAADVAVTIADSEGVESALVLNADYSVTLNANQETSPGGTVTYPISGPALPINSKLSITGDIDYDQPLDLPTGGNYDPITLENQLDRATMQIQQLKEEVDRAAKLPVTNTGDPSSLVEDIVRLADSAANIDTVVANMADINTVASDLNEPVSEINTVAVSINNVNTVGNNIANVNTVAGISANVTSVAGNATNINAVAGNATNINAVNANKTNIDAVASNATNINAVNANKVNIDAVAGNATNINAVNANKTNIDAVAAVNAAVSTVSSNIASVNSAASNMPAIIAAPSEAAAAAASAAAAAASAASGMYSAVQDKSADYTVVAGDAGDLIRVSTAGAARTITLPAISAVTDGFNVTVVKWTGDTNSVTVSRTGSDLVNGSTTYVLDAQYKSATFVADAQTGTWFASGSGGAGTNIVVDPFVGDGTTGPFTLSGDPGSKNNTLISIGGSFQLKSTYTLTGNQITFASAVPVGVAFEVQWSQPLAIGVPGDGTVSTAKIADSNVTTAKIADSNVTTAKIADSNVTTAKIADANVTLAKLAPDTQSAISNATPSGAVLYFARNTAPTGWIKANGAAVSRTTYAALFSAIGTTYGGGDGSTTFNLPDLRGEFIRGWDDGRAVDSGRGIGTAQTDAMQGHRHNFTAMAGTANLAAGGGGNIYAGTTASTTNPVTDTTNGTPRTAAETRPRNVALLACIKY